MGPPGLLDPASVPVDPVVPTHPVDSVVGVDVDVVVDVVVVVVVVRLSSIPVVAARSTVAAASIVVGVVVVGRRRKPSAAAAAALVVVVVRRLVPPFFPVVTPPFSTTAAEHGVSETWFDGPDPPSCRRPCRPCRPCRRPCRLDHHHHPPLGGGGGCCCCCCCGLGEDRPPPRSTRLGPTPPWPSWSTEKSCCPIDASGRPVVVAEFLSSVSLRRPCPSPPLLGGGAFAITVVVVWGLHFGTATHTHTHQSTTLRCRHTRELSGGGVKKESNNGDTQSHTHPTVLRENGTEPSEPREQDELVG